MKTKLWKVKRKISKCPKAQLAAIRASKKFGWVCADLRCTQGKAAQVPRKKSEKLDVTKQSSLHNIVSFFVPITR